MEPLENKEGANSVSLEISKGCEILLKDVEVLAVLAIKSLPGQMHTAGNSSVLLMEAGIVFFLFVFGGLCCLL